MQMYSEHLDHPVEEAGKKGVPWSEPEHAAFLRGLKSLGKGNWRGIARMFVLTRSPTQVASHAQKYFLRLNGCTKRRSRFSGLEQGSRTARVSAKASYLPTTSDSACSDDSLQQQQLQPVATILAAMPHQMMPMPPPFMGMMPPIIFAGPGGGPFFAPMFLPPVAFPKQDFGMMHPFPMGPPPPGLATHAWNAFFSPKIEGGGDSSLALSLHLAALCKPAARPASSDALSAEFLDSLSSASSCHFALQASACSAFRPAGRQVAA